MPRKTSALTMTQETLYRDIRAVLESARSSAYRAVNTAMVQAYWQVGRLIVEHEQGGRKRAAYGEAVLDDLSQRLTADFGKGFTTTNLKYMRSFYLAFPIRHALRDESAAGRVNARDETPSPAQRLAATLRPELSWTHYRLLLGVEDPKPASGTCAKPRTSTGPPASSSDRSRCSITNGCWPAARRRLSARRPPPCCARSNRSSSSATRTCSSSST